MNKDINQYMDQVFGEKAGYVAVASKAGEGKADWSEVSFSWPDQRDDLVDWTSERSATDLFICPALRKGKGRSKGDGAHLRTLWADVDWDKVPADARELVESRIAKLASFTIASGSGDNCHVYVKLRRAVSLDIFRRLNQGLRDYLHADNKHADNSLLRIPGTRNHKPGAGRVSYRSGDAGGHGRSVAPSSLLKREPWASVVVAEDLGEADGSYATVDVRHLLRGSLKALARMPVDEAVGKYGSRHGAVFRVTALLAKRGLSGDEIHTLMDEFPAGVSKQDGERGYDLHTDVSRCLLQQPARDVVQTEDAEDIVTQGDVFEEAPPETAEEKVHARVLARVETWEVDRLAREYLAQRDFNAPPEETTSMLGGRLKQPSQPNRYSIDRIAGEGHNVTITGQFKAGKTLFITNLVRALSEHSAFLDEFKVRALKEGETVGMWSCETSETDLIEDYFRPQEMTGDGVVVWHGRGYSMNIMTDVGRAWTVNWLREGGVGVWIIDSHARLLRMCGVEENDNGAVLGVLHRLDEIKLEAGVAELFLIAHTGRGEMAEGKERARGATSLDDWTDVRWVLTREGDVRFLQVEGRNVIDLQPTSLILDGGTKRLSFGGQGKVDVASGAGEQAVVSAVGAADGQMNGLALKRVLRERKVCGGNQNAISELIRDTLRVGLIEARPTGKGSEKAYWLPEVTVTEGTAASKVLDFSKVRERVERGDRARRGRVKGR